MSGWLRYFTLKAQESTGISSQILIWAIIAVIGAVVAVIFLLVAAYTWLAEVYDGVVAGLVLAGVFALIALVACLMIRRRNMERARLELAARSSASLLDPKLVQMGWQIGQAIGWRRLASLAAVAVLAAGVAKEWSGRQAAASDDDASED